MNLIRITSLLLLVGIVASCGTLKPAARIQTSNYLSSTTEEPHFLEVKAILPQKVTSSHSSQTSVNNFANVDMKNIATTFNKNKNYSTLQIKYSLLLDVPVESITNIELYKAVENWYGTRYNFGGTTKRGVDCSSLMQHIYTEAYKKGIPRTAITQYEASKHISQSELKEGDLIFFHTTRSGISHVGLYLGNRRFVHASSSRGVTVSNLDEKYYANAFRAAGRFAENYNFSE